MDRRSKILELICETERIDINSLSETFKVSQVTIRKDLDQLEQAGLIKREHGYAVAIAPDNLLSRLAVHYDLKRRIAREAATLVGDGDLVMIESGSCCALLAAELAGRRGVTIVTNSAFIAAYIRDAAAEVVLLGGDYQPQAQVTVGPLLAQCVASFHVGRLFIGIDGYLGGEFSGRNMARVAAVRAMAAQCDQTVVLSESSKFNRAGSVSLLPSTEVSQVVTDDGIDLSAKAELEAAGVLVTLTKRNES